MFLNVFLNLNCLVTCARHQKGTRFGVGVEVGRLHNVGNGGFGRPLDAFDHVVMLTQIHFDFLNKQSVRKLAKMQIAILLYLFQTDSI